MYKIIVRMDRRRLITCSIAALALFLLFPAGTAAREIPLPDEEDATALFDAELEDAEVDFFIQGNWTANLSGGFGVTWGDTVQGVQPAVVPDFTDGFLFNQTPQLTLSLWYRNRYFFETAITKEQTLETFLFGYYGEEGEFLQEARIGNTDIGYGEAGTFSIPAASRDSLGAYALMSTESTTHQAAVRYDPAQSEEVSYRGSNLIEEERLEVRDFVRGRFFVLPDDNVENLEVYLQDDSGIYDDGAGRSYRRLDSSEMVVSSTEGLVFLKEPAGGDVAVHYTKGGLPVGADTLGTNALCGIGSSTGPLDLDQQISFAWTATEADYFNFLGITDFTDWQRQLSGKSNPSLLLYSPGQWSPFEIQGVYGSGGLGTVEPEGLSALLTDRNGSEGPVLPIVQFQDPEALRISPEGFGLREHEARYPLLTYQAEFSDAQYIYGPDAAGSTEAIDRELLLEKLSPVSSYNIGSNALEGSVEVLRNGVPTGNFTFNPDTGEINFFIPPASGERIDIRYRSQTSKAVGGDIYAVTANTFQFSEKWSADLNAGLRWNADPNAFITEQGEADGSILTSGRISYSSENFSFSLEGGVDVSSPNTTGRLRLFGMDDTAFPVSLNVENLYPGAPLVDGVDYTSIGSLPGSLPHSSRGALYYRDYFDYSFAQGYQLRHYSWDPPDDQIYTYDQAGGDNRIGPYLVATGSETEGNAMVLEYELTADQWVAGTIPIASGGGAVDLSHTRAITMLIKSLGRSGSTPDGDIDIHVILGRLCEDLDDDDTLDEESSPYDQGFTFNINGATAPVSPALTWAPQDSLVNTEDLDGNGVLDGAAAALPEPFIDADAADGLSPGGWTRLTIPLDSSSREKLQAVTGIEIVLEESAGTTASGRILVADIDLQGTPFTGTATGSAVVDFYTRALDPGGSDYSELYSYSDAELLNGDSVFDTKVLKIDWDAADTITATGFLTPADIGNYESLSFFMKTDINSGDTLTLRMENSVGEGMAVQFEPPASTGWSKYTWHLDETDDSKRITRNGSSITSTLIGSQDRKAVGVSKITLEIVTGAAGSIEIDEIFLHDPILGVGAGGVTDIRYTKPGSLLSIGDTSIVSDIDFQQTVYGRQDEYGGGLTPAPAGNLAFTNQLAFSLTKARLTFDYNGRWDGTDYLPSGGYTAALPLFENLILINDDYHENSSYTETEFTRDLSVRLEKTGTVSWTLTGSLDWDGNDLFRSWGSQAEFEPKNTAPQPNRTFQVSMQNTFITENDQIEAAGEDLWQRYGQATTLLYPDYTKGKVYRSTENAIDFQFKLERFTLGISPAVTTTSHPDETPFSLTTGNSLDLSLSLQLRDQEKSRGTFTFSYGRSGSFRDDYSEDSGFPTDLGESLSRTQVFPMVWTSPPFRELWSPAARDIFSDYTRGAISAAYANSAALSYTRQPGSSLSDLILPKSFSASMQRALHRGLDSVTDAVSIEGEYRTTALNLFGSLGRYPLISWYRTDEISHSLTYEGAIPLTAGSDETHTITAGQLLQLNLDQTSTVGMQNDWSGSFYPDEPGEDYDFESLLFWERKKPVQWELPMQEELKAEKQFLVHREETALHMEFQDSGYRKGRWTGGHTSELLLPETGFARAFARIGYEQTLTKAGIGTLRQYILAFEFGVELELRF